MCVVAAALLIACLSNGRAFSPPTAPRVAAQAAWGDLAGIAGGITQAVKWVIDFFKAGENWQSWKRGPIYKGNVDCVRHASRLVKKLTSAKDNILVSESGATNFPSEPVRTTSIERLVTALLLDTSATGMSAIYAEPGTGKTTAVLLAAAEVARASSGERSDYYVILRDDWGAALRGFFRISDASLTASVASAFFSQLEKKRIRPHLIFDNILDAGVGSSEDIDRLKALARAAMECRQQVIITMQTREAAESIAKLNGCTTRIANQQDHQPGAYRWTESQTEELTLSVLGKETDPERIQEVLEKSEIPDDVGLWRPRDSKYFMLEGGTPKPPGPSSAAQKAIS